MPSLSAINRANYQRDVQKFPKILRDRLTALLLLLVIPNFFMEVYYEGGDRIYKRWSWHHIAALYILNSIRDYFKIPLIFDSLSWFLWKRGLRSAVVMIRALAMLAVAHIWYCSNDLSDSWFNIGFLTWGWTYLTTFLLLPLGVPFDDEDLDFEGVHMRNLGKGRGKFEALFMMISFVLLDVEFCEGGAPLQAAQAF